MPFPAFTRRTVVPSGRPKAETSVGRRQQRLESTVSTITGSPFTFTRTTGAASETALFTRDWYMPGRREALQGADSIEGVRARAVSYARVALRPFRETSSGNQGTLTV